VGRLKQGIKKVSEIDELMLIVALAAIIVIMSVTSEYFLTQTNILNVLRQSSTTLIAGIGMTILLLVGEVDLSIGSLMAFSAVVMVDVLNKTQSIPLAILTALAIGAAVGLFNAFICTKFNINSLIITLGMMISIRGLALIYTNAIAVQNTVPSFAVIGTGFVGPIPIPVIIAAVIFAVCFIMLKYTVLGRNIYGSGDNKNAAVASGINVKKVKLIAFLLCSLFAIVSGVILSARVNSGQPNLATGFEFTVIAAVILGGTSLNGGQGSLIGTLVGVLILGILDNGLVLNDVSSFWQDVVRGAVIIIAVIIDILRTQSREKASRLQVEHSAGRGEKVLS
jgi:ribose transport system permease protein